MRCTLVRAARITVAFCKLHNFIIEVRVRHEGSDIDLVARAPVGSDPDNHILGAPDVFSQDHLHREPEGASHIRQGDGAVRDAMAHFLELSGLVRPSRRCSETTSALGGFYQHLWEAQTTVYNWL
jgi:hypothetical protein